MGKINTKLLQKKKTKKKNLFRFYGLYTILFLVLSNYEKCWLTINNSDRFDEWRFDLSLC